MIAAMALVREDLFEPAERRGPAASARRRRSPARRRRARPEFLRLVRGGNELPRLDGLTVLAVDDDHDARSITRQMLEPLGARVLVAGDADEALRVLGRERASVVLCDILMPGMDGFELTRHLRTTPGGRRLPIVAVTALGRETDYYRTWEAGFDGHLTKPIDYADLAWVVRILTRRRSARAGGAWWGVGEAAGPRRSPRPRRPRPRA